MSDLFQYVSDFMLYVYVYLVSGSGMKCVFLFLLFNCICDVSSLFCMFRTTAIK